MLKKTDVYDYIDKVQSKAVRSLREKYNAELEQAINLELNKESNKFLKNAIEQVESSISIGSQARDIIKKYIPRCDKWNNYFTSSNIKQELFSDDYNFPDGFESIHVIHADNKEKIRKTKEEYAKIKRICQNKKTGDQGRTALIALGFDVTWLNNLENLPVVVNETTMNIDKSLIFPCGEQGV